jgi:hypothetical protein
MLSHLSLLSQSKMTYPYLTINTDGVRVVIMTAEQAELINKKYKELQLEYSNLGLEHLMLKQINEQQGDTIVNQLILIREQRKKLQPILDKK